MTPLFGEYYNLFSEYGNLNAVQEAIDSSGSNFRFEEFVWGVLSGEIRFNLALVLDMLGEVAFSDMNSCMPQIFRVLGIALMAAVFSNFSFSFRESNVADTAFYVCYLILYGILAVTFTAAYDVAADAISHITGFMKVLVPSYCIAIALGNGTVTSLYWYESILIIIALAENLLLKIILPLIGVHMTVNIAGNLSNENILSKLCELLEQLIGWGLKGITAFTFGMSGLQNLLAPAIDRFKQTALLKSAESIPGIGNLLGGLNETMLGAGVLLKDAFGAAGIIGVAAIGILPLLRLAVYSFVYKAEAAVIQPVSDKRIVNCLNVASKGAGMMLKTVFTSAALFVAAIAIVAYTSL